MKQLLAVVVVLVSPWMVGCSSGDLAGKHDRVAILAIDNQSGDPALDAAAVTAQHAVQAMIGSRIATSSESVAIQNGAAALGRGVLERTPKGALRLSMDVFDIATHRLLASSSSDGGDILAAATAVAKGIRPDAKALTAKSPETIERWSKILNSPATSSTAADCLQLLSADPTFSPAYEACFAVLLFAPEAAGVKEWAKTAFERRAELSPNAQQAAGEVMFRHGMYANAAEILRMSVDKYPGSWNAIGYSEAKGGRLAETKHAMAQYRKFGGDEANAVDSSGETMLILKQYQEAEKFFLECAEKFAGSPKCERARLKAAAARCLQGDREGAEGLARAYFDALRKAGKQNRREEELWRAVILEQNPEVMRNKVLDTIIPLQIREQ